MNRQGRISERRRRRQAGRRGFTLIELLVVMLIILLVSAVVLPTLIPAISHRQASEAARILQGALAGARDTAINNNAPAGIRLLPDPVLNGINPVANPPFTTVPNQLDPSRILASNRYIPIQLAPDYSEGTASVIRDTVSPFLQAAPLPYGGGGFLINYPIPPSGVGPLMVEECPVYLNPTTGTWLPTSPTSWFWNIRVGDRIQLGAASQTYIVVGPMAQANPELFVNIGLPGSEVANFVLNRSYPDGATHTVEYLLLVNGKDDNLNGYVDDGWDGIDNNNNGSVDEPAEWEAETWTGSLVNPPALPAPFNNLNLTGMLNLSYSITRRPVVSPGARETPLPSNVVVDLTTWNPGFYNTTAPYNTYGVTWVAERSRLPVDSTTGYVDILLNPNGTVVPTTVYSSPTSFGMGSSFYHFWLAERGDLYDPVATPGVAYLLPQVQNVDTPAGETRFLKGERRLVTLFTRTGAINTNQVETFDGNNPSLPFLLPQQGVRGDTR